ncbi:glutamine--tRNA ligase [Sporobolomyces salmoneus]|uniref:glutamine--tRNA ligase n=1 Tax=Sporobolomyces salmoneus TaxID=183962 RepID=UPI0031753C57
MAPAPLTPEQETQVAYFESCGLSNTRSSEAVRSKYASSALKLFQQTQLDQRPLDDKLGALCLQVAKDGNALDDQAKGYIVDKIHKGDLAKSDQVAAAIKYLASKSAPYDEAEFDKTCGVGFTITPSALLSLVSSYVKTNLASISPTNWSGIGKTLGQMKLDDGLRWVQPLELKATVEKVYEETFGSKEEALKKEKEKQAAAKKDAKSKSTAASSSSPVAAPSGAAASPDDMFATGWLSRLHKPGGNEQVIPERMKEHLEATKGKVFTRFPPEPNGFLHIGHSKAIAVNFGYAKYHQGHCYLRYDDTNPEAEEQIYFDKILENIRWLGYEPYQITHSSDHFQELYELARLLIKKGLAYTSNDTAEEINAQRGGPTHGPRFESKDRNKPIAQSLSEFEDMKNGKYQPGEMTLRMKQDIINSSNPTMWDIIAYRVLGKEHHRTGKEWCIYPTYDFTHCLCDSFENISHSLCTTEFIGARTAYEWLCDALEVYKPRQSEYGRLTLEGAITSKRKLLKLVKEGHVDGWDDPRLYTLVALKRRGVPPAAIISFVSNLGVSTSPSLVQLSRFEQTVRQHLEMSTPRLMLIVDPVKVTIENLPEDFYLDIEKPLHPKDPSMGSNKVPFTKHLFIDRDDFRTESDKNFFRLCPGATVGLLNTPKPITYVSHTVNEQTGQVDHIVCKYEHDAASNFKPKGWIHWIAQHEPSKSPVQISETRMFSRLFKSDNPATLGDKYLEDLDPKSKEVVKGAMVETGVWQVIEQSLKRAQEVVRLRKAESEKNGTEAPPSVDGLEVVRFQASRVAYFCLDLDSKVTEGKNEGDLVLNLITGLKEDKTKVAGAKK